ncbi:hypothetical protein ACS0TY_028457 [Phlomoides rotata]
METFKMNEKYSMPKGWKFEVLNGAESALKDTRLDARRAEVLAHAAKRIQRQIRAHLTRREFIILRNATINFQTLWRGT